MAWVITGFAPSCWATFRITSLTGTTQDGPTDPVNVYDCLSPGSFILGVLAGRAPSLGAGPV
ncbi:hypothetical protein [Streptomyces sp. NPDC046261]|uniref:hypothetical protein n=1 Tax=Streptomyces sp. NPDC046261 TaxID=3157200 RepID=UPI0033E8157C